jgi:hypothetical protein
MEDAMGYAPTAAEGRERGKHGAWTYRRHALTHQINILSLALPGIAAFVTASFVILVVALVLVQVCVLAALPRFTWFRRQVDEQIDGAARAAAATERAVLMSRMLQHHRVELEELERLAAAVRSRSATTAADDWAGLERLLTVYVRVAIAFRTSAEAFRPGDRAQLEAAEGHLCTALATTSGASRPWIERRLAVVRSRVLTCSSALSAQGVMAQELATIAELVRWIHDECVTADGRSLESEIENALDVCRQSASALRELSAMRVDTDPIDPRILAIDVDAPPTPPIRIDVTAREGGSDDPSLAYLPHLRL